MPSKYKHKINSKNRDRRGGHKNTNVSVSKKEFWWGALQTPVMRAFIKRENKRAARREHFKITRQALAEYHDELNQGIYAYELDEDLRGYWENLFKEWKEFEEEKDQLSPYDYDDGDFDPGYSYDPYLDDPRYPFLDDMLESPSIENLIIRSCDQGKSLGQVLREHGFFH